MCALLIQLHLCTNATLVEQTMRLARFYNVPVPVLPWTESIHVRCCNLTVVVCVFSRSPPSSCEQLPCQLMW